MKANPNIYVLDSYALLAMFEEQPGAERVSEIISGDEFKKYMSVINLGEVLYITERRRSTHTAKAVKDAIIATDGIKLIEVTLQRAVDAASIKARGGLSYADCFAIALAKEVNGTILTGDPEFSNAKAEVKIEWLR